MNRRIDFMNFMGVCGLLVLTLLHTTPSYGSTTTTPPAQCTPPSVSDSSFLPNQISFNVGETVTYTCDTGYELTSGSLILGCDTGGTWNETAPACSIKTCAAVDIANGTRIPLQAYYNYNTIVTYSCETGYTHASGDLSRTCTATKTWSGTDPVCELINCSSIDVLSGTKSPAFPSVAFNTSVAYACDFGYQMTIGDAVRTCRASGDLSGTLPVCSIKTCASAVVSNAAMSPNTTTVDYNTALTYTCDTGYSHTNGDLSRTCQENSTLSGEAPTCTIKTCASAVVSNAAMSPNTTTVDYNTALTYTCDTGYNHTSGDLARTCQENSTLSGEAPTCTIINCSSSVDVIFGTKSPASSSVTINTTVTYVCDLGYAITSGDAERVCQASGDLSGTRLVCSMVNCSSVDVVFGEKLPASSIVIFNTTVTYACDLGYVITSGDAIRTCKGSGDLSGALPVCSIKTCTSAVVSNAAMLPNTPTVDYNTALTYTCDTGYNHTNGDLSRTCQANSTLSGEAPTCTIVTCAEPANITYGTKSPIQSSYDYSEKVTYTCGTGYKLDTGDLIRTCTADGTWSGVLPACTNVTCAAPSTVAHSSHSPIADPYLYATTITYSCDTGYERKSGHLSRYCKANGLFSGNIPVCSIKTCAKEEVANGTAEPDQALYNYDTNVTYTCNLSFNHTSGDLVRRCNETALWTNTLPVCTVAACIPENITDGRYDPPDITTEFGDTITYSCDLGYYIASGDTNRTCLTNGGWTNTLLNCSLVRCDLPDAVPYSSYLPPLEKFDYNTSITFDCDLAYNHTFGNLTRTCKEDFSWSGSTPNCSIAACIQENSTYMTTTPDKVLHEFDDYIIYECLLGYNHSSGDLNRTCQNDGNWTGVLPECVIVTCDTTIPAHASIIPDVAEINYNSSITYACDLGYNRTDGDETRRCTETAAFEGVEANCTLVTCEPPDAIGDASYDPVLAEHDYNTTVNFTCDFGYYILSGNPIQRCDENANWVNEKPVCEIMKCPKPTEDYATVFPDQSQYNFNTSVTSTCVTGYNLTDGDATRTCQHTGEWGGTPPNCTIVECDAPPPVIQSSLSPIENTYVYLDTLTYTCDTGYERTSGNDVRNCMETGEWTGSAPNCTIIHCPIPADGVRNTYSPVWGDYVWNDTIEYTCDIGYNHSSGDLTSRCLDDKTWSGTTPICVVVTCDKIDVPNMTFDPPTADTHDFNTTIEYACVIGYNHSYGDLIRTCNYTGEWTGLLPNCTIVECDAPPPVSESSLTPSNDIYVYLDNLTYICDIGYERTSGNDVRVCTETKEWTGSPPNCTIIHCPIPAVGVRNTYSPVWGDYVWNDTIEYTCDIGYNHSTGDLTSRCLDDKTWSGTTPVCVVVTCDKIDVPFMTFDPPTADTHDFNTTIEYACVLGYNHSYGDLIRVCNYTGEWTGTLPNCTIITCDPPDPIPHTLYVPNGLVEHDWNTSISYSCDAGYHYISGGNITTCNESGSFPPSDVNCSVQHEITVSQSEPAITWLNTTVNETSTVFDFDGVCDVTITCDPDLIDASHVITGTQIIFTVKQTASTQLNEYVCSLSPFRGERTFPVVTRDVFFGEELLGFQAWLGHSQTYIQVGESYQFKANATQGSVVYMIWEFEDNITQNFTYSEEFTDMDFTHIFNSPWKNVTVSASNVISNAVVTIQLSVIYALNGINFNVNDEQRTTTETAHFELLFDVGAQIPMATLNTTITLHDGNTAVNIITEIEESLPPSPLFQDDVIYDVQGNYNVTVVMETPISSIVLFKNMRVWDKIDNVDLACLTNCPILITNTQTRLEFTGVPRSGFEYSIEMKDGTTYQNFNSSILYELYSLTHFNHNYTSPGYYYVAWDVSNGGYSKNGIRWMIVQNEITDFQAILDHTMIYLAVGDSYNFFANATEGTNITLEWEMESNITKIQTYPGEFTTGNLAYSFTRPKHNISVTAKNLISSETLELMLEVFYKINNFNLSVASLLGNTTEPVEFNIHLLPTANIPMNDVNISINFKHGNNTSDNIFIDEAYEVDKNHMYSHLFDLQGNFLVEVRLTSILGYEDYSLPMRIWDSLLPLELEFINGFGKYIITNTTAEFNFTNLPVYGYKYTIDYGDGTTGESNLDDSILYQKYNLPLFTHVYTIPGVYKVSWTAVNGEPYYDRAEHFVIHVQNKVPDTGYTLEPIGKKYPWSVLQNMSLTLNITLDVGVPEATNATCIFDPNDGKVNVGSLVYDSSYFQRIHDYHIEGFFNATLNCSNDVSYHVYAFDIEVKKCVATDISLVFHNYVPHNVSESVVVFFHIDNGGFALIPNWVYIDWDFGDGSTSRRRRSPLLYDKPTFEHEYTERGNYTVTISVEAQITSTSNTLMYSLRLGLMYFEYNTTVQFIDTTLVRYTMYGVKGTATYTIDFDDTTSNEDCTATGASSCDIHHLCPEYGYQLVQVVASNGSFIEIDNMNMTCDNPIVNLTTDIIYTVAIPNGTIDARLRIKEDDLYLPKLFCNWNMGDPIKRETYGPMSQEVTFASPFLFNFQYIALGRHKITIDCWNLINETKLEAQIIVTNKDFLFTGVFDRFYSQEDSPMYISSMTDTEIFSRLEIVAHSSEKYHTNFWNVSVGEANPNRHSVLFTRGLMEERKYYITLQICFKEEPNNCIFEPTFVQFVMPPPHAEIVGSKRRYIKRGSVTVDAYTFSYDPVFPDSNNLIFSWACRSFDATDFDDAAGIYAANASAGVACSYTGVSTGVITLDTNANPTTSYYVAKVTVDNTRSMTSTFTQILAVKSYDPLTIKCRINCLSKVARSSKLQLVPNFSSNCPATFTWTLQKYSGSAYADEDLSSIASSAGTTARSLTIKENELEYGTGYLVSLKVLLNGITYGPAYYEFVTNRPPEGGFCQVIPFNSTTLIPMEDRKLQNTTTSSSEYDVIAGIDVFNLTCQKWMDEGFTDNTFSNTEPLFYLFFLSYGDDNDNDNKRQLLYFDPGATSNLVSLQVGNVNDDFRATIVLRITDVLGDYTDVRYKVKSKPSLTTSQLADLSNDAMLQVVSAYIEQFDEDLIKANRTYDYRTISRKVMDISSVYNELALNTSSGIILSPEDLLTLGYVKREDDTLLSWQDYWKIIVEMVDTQTTDYLIQVGEQHAYMLHASIMSWPSSKRMTLVAIETISRALNESTAITEYSNVTAAILSSESSNVLARNLADISSDRTFPNTEQLFAAAIGVRDLIRNLLAILQTVLTPNLPQDPTVDEMRKYLEYISVFKTTEEVLNAPLSLQEQTFLAQKQLQKYHLQKYIKSEASKRALPHLTYALQNLTYVLGQMSVLGEEKLYLENDFIYISVEIKPAYSLNGGTIDGPRVALELNGLVEDSPAACNSSEITLRTIVFKENPYFWGQFADRITSYVPVFEIDGASLTSNTITYRLENKVEASCVDQDPTYEEDDPDKMIYILFDRQHAEDDMLIFVRPNTSELVYELYFNKDEKPKISEDKFTYSTEMKQNDNTWTLEDGYKLLIKSSDYSETGKIWIALRPLLANSGDLSLLTRKFCANVTSVNCLAWRQESGSENYMWDKDMCEVSLSSTRSETVCTCQNTRDTMTVGTTFYVPYSKVDFKTLDTVNDAIGRSPVIGMMVATFCVYVLLVIWAWREDVKDQYKWSFSLMIDNDIADSYFYVVRVFTGLRTGAGTQSKIGFVLVGEDGDTNIRILDDDSHIGFERGSIRTFVMSTRKYLGELICLRIWHDDSGGNNSSWYLNKVNVTDLKSGTRYSFVSNQWFDYDSGDTRVDRVVNAQRYEDVRSYQDMIAYTLAEHHLWLSVLVRPIRSNFTRVQRLSCLLGLVYLTMIICTMIVESPDEDTILNQAIIGPFRFSMENFKTALVSVTVSSVIIIIVSVFFRSAENAKNSPNIDSVIHKAYRKVNNKLKLDTSVLGRRYWPPAEEALEHNYYFLPHFCVYVGWTFLAMALIVATFLLVSFSSDWELVKSEEWMTAVFVSFLTSVLLIEGIKIIVILLIYSLMCQRAYEPLEPHIDIDRLEEITKYNSATLTIGPQFNSVLHKPENPSKATLIKNKVKRIRNHQLLKIVSQLVVYSGLLYMVYTISYETRDPRSFYFKNHVEQMFHFTSEVTDLESYTNWLKGTFINTYFSKTFFGATYDGTENKIYMEDLTNLRVGPARLRQLRIKPEDCIGPLGVNLTCHNKYEEKKKETQDFCLGWKKQPCPVSEKSTYFSSAAWEFTSADEVWGFPTVAQYCTYGGGGYFMKLDVNRDVCEIIFDELVQFTWFDVQTRAVILEFTLYNANTNLFVYSKFVGEFPEVGGFLPYIDIQVFRLFLNSGPDGDFLLFLQFFFLLIVIAATFSLAYLMFTDVKAFFKSVWNILDLIALIMSYTTISIFIYKISIIQKTIKVFENDKNAYVGFENLAFYDFITNTAYGVLVFLLSVRVSRILGYSGKINEMAAVISNAASDLYGFLLIFGITYFAYVIWGTLLFGKEQEKYKDFFQTYGTLTEAIIGKNRVSNILTAKPGFAEFYYFTFVLFVLMTLATMAAAILNFSISMVRKEHQKLAPTNIIEVVFDRIGKLLDKFRSSTTKKDNTMRERRDSDAELNDILVDLRVFIRGIRSKKKKEKASDKYRLAEDDTVDS